MRQLLLQRREHVLTRAKIELRGGGGEEPLVAVKHVPLPSTFNAEQCSSILQDLHILYRENPENADDYLVHCSSVQASSDGYTLSIQLSFMNRFSLADLFRPPSDSPSSPIALQPVRFPESMCCYVADKILNALDFLQRKKMLAHGNVKGSNVLVNSNGDVKLSDLQSCKKLREEFRQSSLSIVSSSGGHSSDKRFRAPEHGFPGHKKPNQDVWSVGIIVAELAAGRPLYDSSVRNRDILKFYGDTSHEFHPGNLHKTMPELQGMSDAFHDFLDEVFLSSAERPFAVQLVDHNIWLEGKAKREEFAAWLNGPDVLHLIV